MILLTSSSLSLEFRLGNGNDGSLASSSMFVIGSMPVVLHQSIMASMSDARSEGNCPSFNGKSLSNFM